MKHLWVVLALSTAAIAMLVACGGSSKNDKTSTPGNGATSAATSAGQAPNTGGDSVTAGAGTTSAAGDTAAAGEPTVSPDDATTTAAEGGIEGGNPDAKPVIVATVPPVTPRAGTTPVIDSTAIAPPNPPSNDLAIIVDMDASTPGIQSSRDMHPGDTFRVAIVAVNIPPYNNNLGGVSALNFVVNYDKTKIVAPSIAGGPPTDRNPRLNVAALGGDAAGWTCLPAPEGDLDDPGGTDGDGKPATGQAFLSCYATGVQPVGGKQVVATVEFTAIATGSSDLKLSDLSMADALGVEFAHCEGDAAPAPFVPCPAGTANVN